MGYKTDWKLVFLAGIIPCCIGIGGYLTTFIGSVLLYRDDKFRVLWQTLPWSINELEEMDVAASIFFSVAAVCFWQLLIIFGILIASLSYFGIRNGLRWCWYLCLIGLVWGAGNDTAASILLYTSGAMNIPSPIFVDIFGIIGLWRCRDILTQHKITKTN